MNLHGLSRELSNATVTKLRTNDQFVRISQFVRTVEFVRMFWFLTAFLRSSYGRRKNAVRRSWENTVKIFVWWPKSSYERRKNDVRSSCGELTAVSRKLLSYSQRTANLRATHGTLKSFVRKWRYTLGNCSPCGIFYISPCELLIKTIFLRTP